VESIADDDIDYLHWVNGPQDTAVAIGYSETAQSHIVQSFDGLDAGEPRAVPRHLWSLGNWVSVSPTIYAECFEYEHIEHQGLWTAAGSGTGHVVLGLVDLATGHVQEFTSPACGPESVGTRWVGLCRSDQGVAAVMTHALGSDGRYRCVFWEPLADESTWQELGDIRADGDWPLWPRVCATPTATGGLMVCVLVRNHAFFFRRDDSGWTKVASVKMPSIPDAHDPEVRDMRLSHFGTRLEALVRVKEHQIRRCATGLVLASVSLRSEDETD
jgi:hypothetical protein